MATDDFLPVIGACALIELFEERVLKNDADASTGVRAMRPKRSEATITERLELSSRFALVGVSFRHEPEIPVRHQTQDIIDLRLMLGRFGTIESLGIPQEATVIATVWASRCGGNVGGVGIGVVCVHVAVVSVPCWR